MNKKSPLPYSPTKAIRHLSAVDSQMRDLIELVGPFKLKFEFSISPFQSLLRAIVFQQLATSAATAIYQRFQSLFVDPGAITPQQVLALSPDLLSKAGLSRAKCAAVLDLSDKCVERLIPDTEGMAAMSDSELIACLSSVRGIGPWTAEIMLLHRLARPDILPTTDLGIRKGYQLAYQLDELPTPKALLQDTSHWSPFRSVASWYLWRATDSVDWSARQP